MSSNVVVLPAPTPRRSSPRPDPLAALAALATHVAQIGSMTVESREDIEQAIFLLGQSNTRARRLIDQLNDDESRMRLLAHSERIEDLIAIARRKAAT